MQNAPNLVLTKSAVNENLMQARELVKHLEAGDIEKADIVINEICSLRENNIFQDLGKLTRDLHESFNEIGGDTRLNEIMHNEMPDAKHDLDYVVTLTEDAANQTLSAIEHSTPILHALSERTINLQKLLHGHTKKLEKINEVSFIKDELDGFFHKVCSDIKHVNKDMNTILLAQSYQDISGQIIQRVNKMVQDVEKSLVGILKTNSHYNTVEKQNDFVKNRTGYGPTIPEKKSNDVLTNQSDVDDLLSTLGF